MIQVGQVNVETELLYSWLIMLIGLAGTEVITGPLIGSSSFGKNHKNWKIFKSFGFWDSRFKKRFVDFTAFLPVSVFEGVNFHFWRSAGIKSFLQKMEFKLDINLLNFQWKFTPMIAVLRKLALISPSRTCTHWPLKSITNKSMRTTCFTDSIFIKFRVVAYEAFVIVTVRFFEKENNTMRTNRILH